MRYRKFAPASHLAPYVECFYVWEGNPARSAVLQVESPPSGFASLTFNYGDAYRVSNPKGQQVLTPASFVSGQATQRYQLSLSGQIGIVGVVLKPAAFFSLFGVPMYEFTDERTDLTAVLGTAGQQLQEQLLNAPTDAARIALLENFLTFQLSKTKQSFDRTDYAANLIVTQRGIVNVSDLMNELYVCRRQFERKFMQKVGVSPKYYARIRRVGYLCSLLASQRWQVADWQDLIYLCGYYDQSHFIKEFTEFMGKSPSSYVKNNAELANFLS
ncbi:MAG: helix-turn-helix transcriptional regulator [Spirosomataceae bacterium]